MRVDESPTAREYPAPSWEEFISDALSCTSFNLEKVSFDNGFSCVPTAVTAVNVALIDRAIAAGERGIVIAVSDYQKEALAYCLNAAVDSARSAGLNRNNPLPEDVCRGNLLCFDNVVVKFLGVVPVSEFGDCAQFIFNDVSTSLPIAKLPVLHHCTSRDAPPRVRGKAKMGTGSSLGKLAARHRACDEIERAMLDGCSSIPSAIGFAIPSCRAPNTTPTQLSKGLLRMAGRTMQIASILPSAHFTGKTELKTDYAYPSDITPALVLSSRDVDNAGRGKLSDFLNYLDDGGVLSAIVVELDNEFAVDDGYINDIVDIAGDNRVPVIIFCDLVTASSAVFENELRFPVISWSTSELESVYDVARNNGSSLSLSAQQLNYLHRSGSVMTGYTEPPEGTDDAARELFEIVNSSYDLPKREQSALVNLLRLFGQMLKRTCVCSNKVAQMTSARLEKIEEILCGEKSSRTLSPVQEQTIDNICSLLRRLTARGEIPSKQEKVWERIIALDGDPLYLVVSDAGSRDEEQRYWRHALERGGKSLDSLTVLSLREFMRMDLSEDPAYVIFSGWFNREDIGRALMSGNSRFYYSLLYLGSNLESAWRQKAETYWAKNERMAIRSNVTMLNRLGISRQVSDGGEKSDEQRAQSGASPFAADNLSDALRIVGNRIDTNFHRGDDGVPARPVYFTDGDICWLECSEAYHARLITVTDCLSSDGEHVRKPAALLEPGDVVLKIDNDDALVSDAGSQSNDYERALSQARAWYKPIEDARANNRVLPRQAIHLIQLNGCKRGKQTIHRWVTDDTCIAPDDDNDIRIIGKAFGTPFSDEDIKMMRAAEKYCLGSRISKGRSVADESIRLFVEEARKANSFEVAERQFTEKYANQGELKVYYVDWVGDERMTTQRLGWYSN